mgnify:CR=1 FL=1
MRKRSTTIGEILVGLGRISPEDVERALAYQREWGGYFGDALVALDLATPAEVKWGLADQYDLPFVNLRPDGIDRAVAALVPPGWAREHLVLPVLRDGDTVTVVLSDPRDLGRLIEVQQFTGAANVEAALSTPATLRALIDAVHGEPDISPIPVLRFLLEALESGAEEVGVSIRAGHAGGWARRQSTTHRTLDGDALHDLRRLVSPFPDSTTAPGVRRWPARIALSGLVWTAECHAVGDGAALEWAARITGEETAATPQVWVDPDLRAAVGRALRAGNVVVEAWGEDEAALERALPGLPALLLDREPRAVHLSDSAAAVPGAAIAVPVGESLRDSISALAPFALEALSLDVGEAAASDLTAARHAAPLVVARAREAALPDADFRLVLRSEGAALLWTRHEAADAAD